jgi:hypothetical protein
VLVTRLAAPPSAGNVYKQFGADDAAGPPDWVKALEEKRTDLVTANKQGKEADYKAWSLLRHIIREYKSHPQYSSSSMEDFFQDEKFKVLYIDKMARPPGSSTTFRAYLLAQTARELLFPAFGIIDISPAKRLGTMATYQFYPTLFTGTTYLMTYFRKKLAEGHKFVAIATKDLVETRAEVDAIIFQKMQQTFPEAKLKKDSRPDANCELDGVRLRQALNDALTELFATESGFDGTTMLFELEKVRSMPCSALHLPAST